MAVLRAYSGGLALPGIQPRGRMQIDWSHPLANGLSYLRVLNAWGNARALFNDNGDEGAFTPTGTPILGVTAGGIGLSSAAGAGAIQYGTGSTSNYVLPQTKGTCVAQVTAGFAANDGVAHTVFRNIFTAANSIFDISKWTDNNWYCGWQMNIAHRVVVSATGSFNAGDIFSIALTYDTAVNSNLYIKGTLLATNATPPVTGGGAATMMIGDDNTGIGNWCNSEKDAIHYVGFWNRVLSTDEIALLNADPYCFLTSAEGEMPAMSVYPTLASGSGGGSAYVGRIFPYRARRQIPV